MKCAVLKCNNSNESKASVISFFRFPTDNRLRKKWISFCGRKILNANTAYVCMHHFEVEDFANNLQYNMGFAKRRFLKDGVVPTINIGNIKNVELHEKRARRIERRENKKSVNLLLENSSSLTPSQKDDTLQSIESIDISMENIGEIQRYQSEKQSKEILNVGALKNEILILRKEKKINDAALKMMKDRMEKMEKMHKRDKEKTEKCLAKAKFELACVEKKLQVIFTKGQIRKLKNGIKRQVWSDDDVAHSSNLYAVSPKMYRLLYKMQFPLPAVRTLQSWAQTRGINKNKILPQSY